MNRHSPIKKLQKTSHINHTITSKSRTSHAKLIWNNHNPKKYGPNSPQNKSNNSSIGIEKALCFKSLLCNFMFMKNFQRRWDFLGGIKLHQTCLAQKRNFINKIPFIKQFTIFWHNIILNIFTDFLKVSLEKILGYISITKALESILKKCWREHSTPRLSNNTYPSQL